MQSTTPTILELLQEAEMAEPEMFQPSEEHCPEHDRTVGTIEDKGVRRFYALAMHYRREQKRAQLEIQFTQDKSAKQTIASEALRYRYKADLLMELFWYAARTGFAYWEPVNIGVRKGWVLVSVEQEHDIITSLGRLLGGS